MTQTLGPYEILGEIGRGGMAIVYKALDPRLGRPVALKVLMPQLTTDPAFVERFQREAKMAGRLQHPNIVTIYDVGEIRGTYYIAMQFLDGQTLQQIIANGVALPLDETKAIVAQVADALDYAHSQGVVHRDIKPTNIMVGRDGRVTLTDFGIARAAEDSRLTGTGQMIGTPHYMAPEQVQVGAADRRTDVYALGIVLFEMLTGRVPFQATTPLAVLHKQAYEPPPSPRSFNPALPVSVEGVLQVALAKDPQQRFRSAGQMVRALEGGESFVPLPPDEPPTVVGPVPAPVWRRERKGLLLALFAVGAVAIVLFIVVLATAGGPGGETPLPPASTTRVASVTRSSATPSSTEVPVVPPTNTPAPVPPTNTSTSVLPTDTPVRPTWTPTSPPDVEPMSQDPVPMVSVPAGCFLQGSTSSQIEAAAQLCLASESAPNPKTYCARSSFEDEAPQHQVCLEEFRIDQFEVTNARYQACVRAGMCSPPQQTSSNRRDFYYGNDAFADYPVVYVTWYNARDYCSWAGKRLPTEAEWEKAARGESGAEWPWGHAFARGMCNTRPAGSAVNSSDTVVVGGFDACASPYGAMDMVGNVWEWVDDWYARDYYSRQVRDNPTGPATTGKKVFRGSSWNSNVGGARAASRAGTDPGGAYFDIGFRCADD
jgi:serine/threonine-protein kinase